MTRRAKPLSLREVEQIVGEVRARPATAAKVAKRFRVSTLTVERLLRVRRQWSRREQA